MPSMASTVILVLLTIPSLTSALTIHNPTRAPRPSSPEKLFGRAACGDASYAQCGTDLPSEFCCPTNSICMGLAGGTTALCCPIGSDCSQIQPIPCDLSLEDKSKYPSATVMTNALTGTLDKCGTNKCCPFGYSCENGQCNMKDDQSAKPSTSSAALSSTISSAQSSTSTQTAGVSTTTGTDTSATPTSSSSATSSSASSTATSAADSTSPADSAATSAATAAEEGPSSSNAGLVAGGVIGAVAGLALLGMLVLFFIKRERRRKAESQSGGEGGDPRFSSSFGNILHQPVTKGPPSHPEISGPIINENGTWRSDFTRKASVHSPGSFRRHPHAADEEEEEEGAYDAHHDGASYTDELHDEVASLRDTPRSSPPRLIDPNGNGRVVSSMYGSFYDPNDPVRQSEYQGPIKMPSARHFGGDDRRASIGGNDYPEEARSDEHNGYGARVGSQDTDAAYIDVFADRNALAPPPLGDKRETRFSDFGR